MGLGTWDSGLEVSRFWGLGCGWGQKMICRRGLVLFAVWLAAAPPAVAGAQERESTAEQSSDADCRVEPQPSHGECRGPVREMARGGRAGGATALDDATLAALLMRPRTESRVVMLATW